MLFKSALMTEARGSVGGLTASRNRYGPYFRERVVPVNPNSTRQQTVRNRWMSLADAWTNILTQDQRDEWNLYGDSILWQNKLGDEILLTGYSHFQRSNGAILASGGPRVDDGPTVLSLPGSDPTMTATVSEGAGTISVVFDNTLAWANEDDGFLLIEMSKPKVGSRSYIGGPTRVAGAIAGDGITPPTSPETVTTPYPASAGQNVEVLARIVRVDGRVSQLFRDKSTVTA